MSTKIEGGPPPLAKHDVASTSGIGRAGFSRPGPVEAPAAIDNLRLTDEATELRSVLQRKVGAAGEGIDQARVERIRAEIESGSYRIDAGAIADRMIALDREIGR